MSEKDEFGEIATKLCHEMVRRVGWSARYQFTEKALREADSNARIEAYLNAAKMFNRYAEAATKEEVYAYSRCEMYCLGMAQEVAENIRELEKNG